MKVRSLGSLLLLALFAAPSAAQTAPPATARPPAQPPVADPPAPLPPTVEVIGPGTSVVIEPAEPDKPVKVKDDSAGCSPLWHWGDGSEYLLWYIKNSRVPPLVVGTAGGAVAGGNGGVPVPFGPPGARVLFGDTAVDMEDRSGGRFTLSLPLNAEKSIGFHATYFFLGSREVSFLGGGDGGPNSPLVARPYVDAATGADALRLIAAPGYSAGIVHVSMTSRLQGVEANGVANVLGGAHYQIDLLAGFRFLQLAEGLAVEERENYLAGAGALAGTGFAGDDRLATNTRFYGGQVGTRLEFHDGGAFMNVSGQLAFGDSVQVLRYGGTSISAGPGGTSTTATGDLFALRSNVGRYARESFALLPELDVRVGWAVTPQARFFVGYSLVYLSDAVRPGDQIDRTVNVALVPGAAAGAVAGPNRPAPLLRTTDFWAQGLILGCEYSY